MTINLSPELVIHKLVNKLDEKAKQYACSTGSSNDDIVNAYKAGALKTLEDVIDLLKEYADLHES